VNQKRKKKRKKKKCVCGENRERGREKRGFQCWDEIGDREGKIELGMPNQIHANHVVMMLVMVEVVVNEG
jgi:hypothetical protein